MALGLLLEVLVLLLVAHVQVDVRIVHHLQHASEHTVAVDPATLYNEALG